MVDKLVDLKRNNQFCIDLSNDSKELGENYSLIVCITTHNVNINIADITRDININIATW